MTDSEHCSNSHLTIHTCFGGDVLSGHMSMSVVISLSGIYGTENVGYAV